MSLGLSIKSVTNTNSTALHWCAFVGAELSLSYVLAWGADVNSRDSSGKTPLHLAVKNYQNDGSIKVIKMLLIKGADRASKDFKGKIPLDYLPCDDQLDFTVPKIRQLLQDTWSFKADFLMVKPAFKKQKRSSFTLGLYFASMSVTYFGLWNSAYYILYHNSSNDITLWISNALFVASLTLALIVSLSEPGQLYKQQNFDFVEMLTKYEANSLCAFCEVIRAPRSRHCNLCGRCVDRFDHHCPWVNNCIGRKNFVWFYSFVVV